MSIFDSYRKKQEEKRAPHVPPGTGHTLAEILQDKNRSHLFGKLLERNGQEDIAKRMAEGSLDENDIGLLEEQRKIFSEKMSQVKKIESGLLTNEQVISLARNNPDFEKIVNLVGPDRAIKVFKQQLENLSITDPGRFDDIVAGQNEIERYRNGEYKDLEQRVKGVCEKYKVDPTAYMNALSISDTAERQKELRKLIREKYGFFKKAVDIKGWLSREQADTLGDNKNQIDISIQELSARLSSVGSVLAMTYDQNEDVRKAFLYELTGTQGPKEEKQSFKEAQPKEKDIEDGWKKFKTDRGFDPARITAAELQARQDEFANQFNREHKAKSDGFWAQIFDELFETMLNNKKKELK